MPQAGTLLRVQWPDAPFVRVDAGFESGDIVPIFYDPMLAKIISWGRTRSEATERLIAALRETVVHGVVTNIPMLIKLLQHDGFVAGEIHTGWLDKLYGDEAPGQGEQLTETMQFVLAAAGQAGPLSQTSAATSAQAHETPSDPWLQLPNFRVGGAA